MNSKWAGIVVLLAVVIYLPVLNNGFVFDDHAIIRTNPTIRNLANIPTFFSTP